MMSTGLIRGQCFWPIATTSARWSVFDEPRISGDANAPYDRARTRVLLARALLEQGDEGRARGEERAARTVFESLGARLDLIRLTEFKAALEASR